MANLYREGPMGGGDRILEEDVRAPVSGLSTHAIKSLPDYA